MKTIVYIAAYAVIVYCAVEIDARANRTEAYARTCAMQAARK